MLRVTHVLSLKDDNARQHELPAVTVTRISQSTEPTTVSIVGTIAARYEGVLQQWQTSS